MRTSSDLLAAGLVFVAFHGVRLATARLAVHEHSCMKALDNLLDKIVHPNPFENGCLVTPLVKDLIEFVLLCLGLLRVTLDSNLSIVDNFELVAFTDTSLGL